MSKRASAKLALEHLTKANDADSDPSRESYYEEDTFESETYLFDLSDSTNDESDDETYVEESCDCSNGECDEKERKEKAKRALELGTKPEPEDISPKSDRDDYDETVPTPTATAPKMPATYGQLETFKYAAGDAGTLGPRWEAWLEGFKLYLEANEINDGKGKVLFKLQMGDQTRKIFHTLAKPEGKMKPDPTSTPTDTKQDIPDTDTLPECYVLMSNYFRTKRSKWTEQCVFRRATKRPDETVDQYVMRLRELTAHCKFGDAKDVDREILGHLVHTTGIRRFESKCCEEDDDLTLVKALKIARNCETNSDSVEGLTKPTPRELEGRGQALFRTDRGQPTRNEKPDRSAGGNQRQSAPFSGAQESQGSDNCNGSPHAFIVCPAWGKLCANCGIGNHFAAACRAGRQGKPKARQGGASRSGTGYGSSGSNAFQGDSRYARGQGQRDRVIRQIDGDVQHPTASKYFRQYDY